MQDQNDIQQNLNQSVPPVDYAFIQSYADPVQPRGHKKLVIAAIIIVTTVIALVISMLLINKRTDQNNQKSQVYVSENAYVSDRILTLLRARDTRGMYELYIQPNKQGLITEEFFQKYTMDPLFARSDFKTCTQLSDTSTTDSVTKQQIPAVELKCNGTNQFGEQRLAIGYTKDGDSVVYRTIIISDYTESNNS